MLDLDQVSYSYPNMASGFAISDVSMRLLPDQIVGLTGRSGFGKTTLANLICGYLRPDQGEIRLESKTVTGPSSVAAMVFQEDGLWPWLTLRENIDLAANSESDNSRSSDDLLLEVGLGLAGHLYPSQLSGGMKKRGEICRVLALQPRVIVLDEALKSLDYQTRCEVWVVLLRFIQRHPGTLVININHDLLDIAENCSRCIVMQRHGPLREIELSSDIPIDQKISRIRESILEVPDVQA